MSNLWQIVISFFQAVWLPAVVFFGGLRLMTMLSGHDDVIQQWREKAAPKDRKELNKRVQGYDTDAVARHWDALDQHALHRQRLFLKLDLVFPLFYGTALAIALWQVWMTFSPVWLIALIAVTVIADWTENFIQLSQLRMYMSHGKDGLQPVWMRIASAATMVKLFFFAGAAALLITLAVYKAIR